MILSFSSHSKILHLPAHPTPPLLPATRERLKHDTPGCRKLIRRTTPAFHTKHLHRIGDTRPHFAASLNIARDCCNLQEKDEMVAKKDEYIKELVKDYPEDTPLEDIIVTDKDTGLNIVRDVLGTKPDKEFRGLGVGRVRDLKGSSLRARQLEEQLATERESRQVAEEIVNAADAARVETQQSLALFMRVKKTAT